MVLTDKVFGGSLLLLALVLTSYWTLWVLVTPFMDAEHPLQAFFPDRAWALALPAFLFVGVTAVAGTMVGLVMLLAARKKA